MTYYPPPVMADYCSLCHMTIEDGLITAGVFIVIFGCLGLLIRFVIRSCKL